MNFYSDIHIGKYTIKRKNRNKRILIIALIAAALVLFLGLRAFGIFKPDSPSQQAQQDGNAPQSGENNSQSGTPGDKSSRGSGDTRADGDIAKLWEGKLVAIDAGHGGIDPGTSGNGLVEKDISLDIALRLDAVLKEAGINTYMTRTTDVYNDLKDVIKTINEKDASLVISIHCDWFEDSSCNGTTTLYYTDKTEKSGGMTDMEYAQMIQSELMKAVNSYDRGIIKRTNLGILKQTTMPAALIEMGFLSNSTDASLLSSEDFRQKAAEGIAEGIKKALLKLESESEAD